MDKHSSVGVCLLMLSLFACRQHRDVDDGRQGQVSAEPQSIIGPDVDVEIVRAAVLAYQNSLIALVRTASMDYPVVSVRERLSQVVRGLDDKSVIFAQFVGGATKDVPLLARFRHAPDGRPMIEFFFHQTADFVRDVARRLGTEDRNLADPILTDWYTFVILHEWFHYQRGHRYDEGVTLADHRRQESEAWMNGFATIVDPAVQEGRFRFPLTDEIVYGYACYKTARGQPNHVAWQAFLDWITEVGPFEPVEAYARQAVDSSGTP